MLVVAVGGRCGWQGWLDLLLLELAQLRGGVWRSVAGGLPAQLFLELGLERFILHLSTVAVRVARGADSLDAILLAERVCTATLAEWSGWSVHGL